MKKLLTPVFFLLILVFGQAKASESIPILTFDELEPYLHQENDTVYIINFWATWCVPCRKELPYFEELHRNYQDANIKVILVSLDFVNRLESATIPFLQKNSITAPVVLLNDPDSNTWIDKVSPGWSGAIPATLVYDRKERRFFEQELDYADLEEIIQTFTKQ